METILRDALVALRALRRAPLLSSLAALSLALGIAANTSVFSALDAFLLRPLPYPGADSLVRVWSANESRGWSRNPIATADFLDYRAHSRTLALAAFAGGSMNLGAGGDAERVLGTRVSADLFAVLGLRPAHGRAFLPEEDAPGAARVVVISDAIWQRRFGGRADALGASLLLDGEAHRVVGILAPGDYFPDRTSEIWTPLRIDAASAAAERGQRTLQALGRVRPGHSLAAARAELATLAGALEREHPGSNAGVGVQVEDLAHATFNAAFRTAATVCMVAVAFVLLIACANVANLLLARAAAREREITVRSALGAGRARIVRQLLTESLVLALAGGSLGLVLATWGVRALVAIMPQGMPMVERVALDARALGFTALVTLAAGLLFGLAPALHASRADLGRVLRESGGRGATLGRRGGRLRAGIVVGQVSLALALLVCAGLLIRSYRQLTAVQLGLATDGVITGRVSLPESQYGDTLDLLALQEQLEARLTAAPGVAAVAIGSSVPLTGGGGMAYLPEGLTELPLAERPVAQFRAVSPGYFLTYGIPLQRGREFVAADRRAAPAVAIVNETFARRHWPDMDPVGRRIELSTGVHEVVGVVADHHEWGGDEPAPAMFYLALAQRPSWSLGIGVRGTLPPERLAASLRGHVRALDPALPVYQLRSMTELVASSYQQDRVLSRLLGIFAGMALLLAIIGVYGVMAYSVTQRTQEVGIRMAIGARTSDVLRLVLREGLELAGIGILCGLAIAAGTARFLSVFLHGVAPYDAPTFAAVSLALLLAAVVACLLPALRASRVDPLTALRAD